MNDADKLKPMDIEERNAKCNLCGAGLSWIECRYYGNRCVICAPRPIYHIFGFWELFIHVYFDMQIYKELLIIRNSETDIEDAKTTIIAVLGFAGFSDINEVVSINQKRKLLKELKGVVNWRTEKEIREDEI